MHREQDNPYGAINLAGYPNETHLRFFRKLEIQGVKGVNSVYNAMIADDKALFNLEMMKLNMPVPKTVDLHISYHDRTIPDYIEREVGFPCVIKFTRLGYGIGIHLAKTKEEFEGIFDLVSLCSSRSANYISNTNLIAQEYIPETNGGQLKVFVLNKEVIGSWYQQQKNGWKIGKKGDGNNVALRAAENRFELTKIEPMLEQNCIKIFNALGINFGCIDVFFGKDGYLFNEINTSPGFARCYLDNIKIAHLVVGWLISK
jgi:ribosomal protein S6--L-glutamate ligase/gamma-F420-2:alpha-L-glutamate ligase